MENITSSGAELDTAVATSTATEKEYPITNLWLFKTPIIIAVISLVALFFGYWYPILVIVFFVSIIANPIIRSRFHYSLENNFFMVAQGVFSKQKRNLPYGVIQHVFVKQDFFDRIFQLASLKIENASGGGQGGKPSWNKNVTLGSFFGGNQEGVGTSGNAVSIPGLKKAHAEELKNKILQKIKDNPLHDSRSGL